MCREYYDCTSIARSKQEAIQAEEIILGMEIETKYSYAIQERVVKAASMAGYLKLSIGILKSMINTNSKDMSSIYIPSSMAYISVLNRLRKWKKIDEMREIIQKLSHASKLKGQLLDVVAFNTYLAALCDSIKVNPGYDDSVELVEEALQLLRRPNTREQYQFSDPDVMSYNTVLHAIADLKNETMICETIRLMKKQGVAPDIATYNAMLKASSDRTKQLTIMDEIRSSPTLSYDKYSIELILLAFAEQGLILDMFQLLQDFITSGIAKNEVANAFSAFLLALVKVRSDRYINTTLYSFLLIKSLEFIGHVIGGRN